MVSSIAPLSLFFSFILLSLSLSISISHSRQKIIRAHREEGMHRLKSMRPSIWVSQMEGKLSNYLESPKSSNSAHQPARYIPPGKEKRRKGDPPFEQDGGEDRYLGQGRSIALDTVAYRARRVQLMVQFNPSRVCNPLPLSLLRERKRRESLRNDRKRESKRVKVGRRVYHPSEQGR